MHGVAESLVKKKRYLIPLVVLQPEVPGAAVVAYLAGGRVKLPKEVVVINADDPELLVDGRLATAPVSPAQLPKPDKLDDSTKPSNVGAGPGQE